MREENIKKLTGKTNLNEKKVLFIIFHNFRLVISIKINLINRLLKNRMK